MTDTPMIPKAGIDLGPAGHAISTVSAFLEDGVHAECSCGWSGEVVSTHSRALRAGTAHRDRALRIDEQIAAFEVKLRDPSIERGQTPEAATAAYELARELEFRGGRALSTARALNAYWRAVGAEL